MGCLNTKGSGLCLHAPVTPRDGGHGDQALAAAIPHRFCQVWFRRHRSRSELADAALSLAVEHGGRSVQQLTDLVIDCCP